MTANSRFKAAMIGLRDHAGDLRPDGSHGLLKSFKALPDVDVVAYCEWAPDQTDALEDIRRMDPAARVYDRLDDLLANEAFDLAAIMIPANETTPTALRLVELGKHLYIEKQAARTAEELRPLRDAVRKAASENGVVVQVGYPGIHNPMALEIKRLIDEGVLGRLVDMEARLVTFGVGPGLRDPDHWMYRHESEGGGILHMEGCHFLNLFRFFSDAEVKSVTALCQPVIGAIQDGMEDVATVALELDNGSHACLHMGYLLPGVGPGNDIHWSLRGTLGTIDWPYLEPEITVASATPAWEAAPIRTTRMDLTLRDVYQNQWGYEYVVAFIQAIRDGSPPLVSIDDAYKMLQVIDASYESSRTGRRIDLA